MGGTTRLTDNLTGRTGNYILPFFWQHGESDELLKEGVEKIDASGIRALCIESRPHPDFLGPKWWHDCDLIMDEAAARGMQVWVLDDSHYPSGYASGLAEREPEYGMRYLTHSCIDAAGPARGAAFQVRLADGEELIAAAAGRHLYVHDGDGETAEADCDGTDVRDIGWDACGERRRESYRPAVGDRTEPGADHLRYDVVIDVTDRVVWADGARGKAEADLLRAERADEAAKTGRGAQRHGTLYFDVPEGHWTITLIKMSSHGLGRDNYINPIDPAAVRRYLETVYQPFIDRYGDRGGVFQGFFADEPGLFNAGQKGRFLQRAPIGSYDLTLPYSGELLAAFKERWGKAFVRRLCALWQEIAPEADGADGDGTVNEREICDYAAETRVSFMELVTRLYQKHFSGQIGEFCRAHGLSYIGHVIEDAECHSETGLGAGHYFRAVDGQDWSGMDLVLQQLRPGITHGGFYRIGGTQFYYGGFYHYVLDRMTASAAQIDPKKHGRAMCEIFGAYGWGEGLRLMKYLADHTLSGGINRFVPHAFTMKDFPDPDHPPHFYARGNNPQFPYFRKLMDYMNRIAHLTDGAVHAADCALLYNAESDWAGEQVPMQAAARELLTHQLDFDVLPADVLAACEIVRASGRPDDEGKAGGAARAHFVLRGEHRYQALVVSPAAYISAPAAAFCQRLMGAGIPVLFVDRVPRAAGGEMPRDAVATPLHELAVRLRARILPQIEAVRAGREAAAGESEASQAEYAGGGAEVAQLRFWHGARLADGNTSAEEVWLFMNESTAESFSGCVCFGENGAGSVGRPASGRLLRYDAMRNRTFPAAYDAAGKQLSLSLAPLEMAVFCLEEEGREDAAAMCLQEGRGDEALFGGALPEAACPLAMHWMLSLKELRDGKEVTVRERQPIAALTDVTGPEGDPFFSGYMDYETTLPAALCGEGASGKGLMLDLGEVGETAEVFVNGHSCGVCLGAPYRFLIDPALLAEGAGRLRVRVVNPLGHRMREAHADTMPFGPSGLLGPVHVWQVTFSDEPM